MNTTMKKMWLGLAAFAVMALATEVKAYTSFQNIDIHVSVDATKSVAVDNNSYTFPAIPISSSSVSGSSITVTNDSNGVVETYQILGATATSLSNDVWDLSNSAVGASTFMLAAIFHSGTQPALSAFPNNSRLNKTTNVVADAIDKLTDTTETGVNVAQGATRHLWFKFSSPSSVVDSSDHKATIVLSVN